MEQTQYFLEYFEHNSQRRTELASEPIPLTAVERRRISKSIQAFQMGEGSEGRWFKAQAKRYAEVEENPAYLKAIHCLIKEENRHAAYLGAFMDAAQIPRAKKNWTDEVFRKLRRLLGLEWTIRVLVTAELIALAYYASLSDATRSVELKRICGEMLREEREHVKFQMFHLHTMNFRKWPMLGAFADLAHAALLAATIAVTWFEHYRVLRIRYGLFSYAAEVWDFFREAMDEGREKALHALRCEVVIYG